MTKSSDSCVRPFVGQKTSADECGKVDWIGEAQRRCATTTTADIKLPRRYNSKASCDSNTRNSRIQIISTTKCLSTAFSLLYISSGDRVHGWMPPSSQRVSFGRHMISPVQSYPSSSSLSLMQAALRYKPAFRGRTEVLLQSSSTDTDFERETDPFKILGLSPTTNKQEIKRAYKRLALKMHPDVVTNKDSTKEERKLAGDRFAKINWAYESLSGKAAASASSASASSYGGTRSSTSSSSAGWEPPHRRKGGYQSSTSSSSSASSASSSSTTGRSTDWRDYIPNGSDYYGANNDAKYDTNGDSFGKIFADLFAGAAGSVAGGGAGVVGTAGGIFKDFVEFLEKNVDGVGAGSDDPTLRLLLQTGTLQEIGNEMDDTQLLVDQLETKLRALQDELWTVQAELRQATRYREQIELETSAQELQARQTVVQDYDRKARKRLSALQTRYKELLVSRRDEDSFRGRGDAFKSTSGSTSSSSSSNNFSRDMNAPGRENTGTRTSASSPSGTDGSAKNNEDAWKTESFGSFGRRGSSGGRRRSRASRSDEDVYGAASTPPRDGASTSMGSASRGSDSSSSNGTGGATPTSRQYSSTPSPSRSTSQSSNSEYSVPPHRRTTSYSGGDDKRRLRELKVDEEFDNLKRELGL